MLVPRAHSVNFETCIVVVLSVSPLQQAYHLPLSRLNVSTQMMMKMIRNALADASAGMPLSWLCTSGGIHGEKAVGKNQEMACYRKVIDSISAVDSQWMGLIEVR